MFPPLAGCLRDFADVRWVKRHVCARRDVKLADRAPFGVCYHTLQRQMRHVPFQAAAKDVAGGAPPDERLARALMQQQGAWPSVAVFWNRPFVRSPLHSSRCGERFRPTCRNDARGSL